VSDHLLDDMPRVLVSDKLGSYAAAHRRVLRSVEHRQSKYLNNRAEVSHQPTRIRRGFRNLRPKTTLPASAPNPSRPGPGRPPGSKNRKPARRHDVGKNTTMSTNNVKTG
jgi:hypothetical protein